MDKALVILQKVAVANNTEVTKDTLDGLTVTENKPKFWRLFSENKILALWTVVLMINR